MTTPKRRTVPPIIDMNRSGDPVTPVDVHVIGVQDAPTEIVLPPDAIIEYTQGFPAVLPPVDPMTMTGSLPILSDVVAAIEGGKHVAVERTTAEQRRADLDLELAQISNWWAELTEQDIKGCLEKAAEYGSGDLEMMGAAMLMLQGDVWDGGDAAERAAVGTELAILFYIHGKLARALAAAQQGKRASDDTIKDIRVYAVMLQRVRETGKWVG